MRFKLCCLMLSLFVGVGCVGRPDAPAAPAWILNPPSKAGMLYGVGLINRPGERDRAIEKARVDLVSQVEISIKAERQQDDRIVESQVSGGALTGKIDSESRSAVYTKVTMESLPGMTVDTVYDGPDQTAALVSLDRRAWANILRNQLTDHDAGLERRHEAEQATAASAPIPTAIRTYRALAPMAAQRAEVARRLRIASPGESIPAAPVDINVLRAALLQKLGSLRLALIAKDANDPAVAIIPKLYDQCAKTGLKIVSYKADADLRLSLTAKLSSTTINGDVRADGQIDGKLAQVNGDRRLAGFTITSRASSVNPDQAQQRVKTKLADLTAQQLEENLLNWLENW